MYGYDAIVQAMLLIGILTILNIVIYALAPFSFDWTQSRGAYALADSSKNLIAKLPKELSPILHSGILLTAIAAVALNLYFNGVVSQADAQAAAKRTTHGSE